MKKLLFRKFLADHISQFLFFGISLSVIVWVIQAVNFLEFVTEDGHGLKIYFLYTILNLPKIFHRLLPFIFLLSLFYQLTKYEDRNELLIFWTHGIGYKNFINIIIIYSFIFTIFQIILGTAISPKSQDTARSFIRSSTIDFFPNLIREKKFIDVMDGLTIFADKKKSENNYSNILLSENIKDDRIKIISAKSGNLKSNDGKKYFELNVGKIIEINEGKITNFSFDKVVYSLDKYKSKTTTYQKIQEVPTINLITCLNNFYLLKNKKTLVDYLQCQEASIDDVKQEIFKRIFKPFYIPLVALICCVVIFISKESINFKRKRFYIFLISFLILTYSEILLKYSGKSIYGFSLFFLMPIIFFIIIYLYTFNLSKNKKESLNA
jgi:lipopolysaccharide export system permease protein